MDISKLVKNQADEIILATILKKSREFLLAHPETKISTVQLRKFKIQQKKFNNGYPLAYLRGYQWFYRRKFSVNKNVLIPRPETELLIDAAIKDLKINKRAKIFDIGTGSGAIAITISLEANISVFASDISTAALKTAKLNAKRLKAKKVTFKHGSLLQPFVKELKNATNILIVSNPPYISAKQMREPSIKHEPRLALYGGADDFSKIERLLKEAKKFKLSNSVFIIEMNTDHAARIKKIALALWPSAKIEILKDLQKFQRTAVLTLP